MVEIAKKVTIRPMPPECLRLNAVKHFKDHNVMHHKYSLFDPAKTNLKSIIHPIPNIRVRSTFKFVIFPTDDSLKKNGKKEIKGKSFIKELLLILSGLQRSLRNKIIN